MRSIHLGFPNRKYDAAASSPEEMTDMRTGPSSLFVCSSYESRPGHKEEPCKRNYEAIKEGSRVQVSKKDSCAR
jgi:hypothetical protein